MTITLTKKGKPVPIHPFDPSLRKGYDTFIVNKETKARFKVVRYWPLTKELKLENEQGNPVTSHVRPTFGFTYEIVRQKK